MHQYKLVNELKKTKNHTHIKVGVEVDGLKEGVKVDGLNETVGASVGENVGDLVGNNDGGNTYTNPHLDGIAFAERQVVPR